MFSELIKEQQDFITVEKLGGNVVKEEFHKGALFGLMLAESLIVKNTSTNSGSLTLKRSSVPRDVVCNL